MKPTRNSLVPAISALALALLALAFPGSASAYIYWTNEVTGSIGRANLDGSSADQSFITGASHPFGVAVDGSHVYWTRPLAEEIGRANLDGTSANQSFIFEAEPWGVAVDASHIYWATTQFNTVGRSNLDGSSADGGFIGGANIATGVAVDGSHIYWTNTGDGTIGRANLNGTAVDQRFISGASQPEGVAVDSSHVYWTNYNPGLPEGLSTIGRANLDGTAVDQNFITGASYPWAVAVDGSHLYWTNSSVKTYSVGRSNLDGTSVDQSFISTGTPGALGIAVDPFPYPTTTKVNCKPLILAKLSEKTTCTATVTDQSGTLAPAGIVTFFTSRPGKFVGGPSCGLAPTSGAQAACHVIYAPTKTGTHLITASYEGELKHASSEGTGQVNVALNLFKIGRFLHLLRIPADIPVSLPGPGNLRLSGRGLKTVSLAVGGRAKGKLATTARPSMKVRLPLKVKLPVKPTAKTRRGLKRRGKVKIKAHIIYTPTGGKPNRKTVKLTLIPGRAHGKSRP
jgi:Low-density lipoprotein receptor repeat class B